MTPKSFIESLAAIMLVPSIIFAFVSLKREMRVHSIKLSSIFAILSITFFSNDVTTYFAALFIIATSVTELDFLQNLAAIIRGNKEYFSYKQEELSKPQIERKIEKEQEQLVTNTENDFLQDNTSKNEKDLLPKTQQIIKITEKALDKIEKETGHRLERNVRFSRDNDNIEIDGLLSGQAGAGDRIFELKYLHTHKNLNWILRNAKSFEYIAKLYKRITNRDAVVVMVLIFQNSTKLSKEQFESLKSAFLPKKNSDLNGFFIFSLKDLGLDNEL